MGKKTDYKRLWKKEKIGARKREAILFGQLQQAKAQCEAYVDVLRRVRDGELVPGKIFEDDKVDSTDKILEDIRQKEIRK